jgi:hypothetical protein
MSTVASRVLALRRLTDAKSAFDVRMPFRSVLFDISAKSAKGTLSQSSDAMTL